MANSPLRAFLPAHSRSPSLQNSSPRKKFRPSCIPARLWFVPQIIFALATALSQVQVSVPRIEVAEEELKAQEKQRIFGVIPNFYVSYVPNAAPLDSKQKFQLAWRSTDRSSQLCNHRSRRRSAAGYQHPQRIRPRCARLRQTLRRVVRRLGHRHVHRRCDTSIAPETGSALFLQRYRQRALARALRLANSVICKGDNGHWQPNYSAILGSLAAGGISNLYYPARIAMVPG